MTRIAAKAARSALRLVSADGVEPDVASPPFSTFSDAELDWLATTAEAETGLSLEFHEDGDERGHMLYARGPKDAPQHPWFVLALPSGASIEHYVENTEATDKFDTHIGPPAMFHSLRGALAFVAAENYGQDAKVA